jgi:hypothetical protein
MNSHPPKKTPFQSHRVENIKTNESPQKLTPNLENHTDLVENRNKHLNSSLNLIKTTSQW